MLEVSQEANPDEIRASYHRLAKKWHPDRFTGDEKVTAEEKFRQLAEAFATLKDPVKRQSFASAPRPQAPVAGAVSAPAAPPAQERSADDWAEEARKALGAGQIDQAKGFVQYAIRLDATRAEFQLLLGQILQTEGRDPRGAVRALEAYLKAKPKDPDVLIELADLYASQGMQARGQRLLEEARAVAPKHKRFQPAAEGKPKAQAPAPQPAGILDQLKGLWDKLAGKG